MNYIYRQYIKRLLDIIFGIIGFVVCSVIFVIIGPIIYLTDKGPILYVAPRLGKDGKVFKMFKFRSMRVNAPDIRNIDGSTYNSEDDSRVTTIGKFIRKTSLDEFPQFINVLIGDMSLIGPRPNVITTTYNNLSTIEKERIKEKPGITGFNQAFYRNSVDTDEKYKYDIFYIENISFILDLKILIKTLLSVLKKENSNSKKEN
jgi:lipopolysaccharide/colanic/teichoic acid biosynthesis glycosyltransferase